MSSETRSPLRTPMRARPAAMPCTRSWSRRQLTRRDAPLPRAGHVGDGDPVVVAALVEPVPQRQERRVAGRRATDGPAPRGRGTAPREAIGVVAEPRQHRVRVGAVLGDEVAGALEAMDVGVRQPVGEVVEVAIAEDRVVGPHSRSAGTSRAGDAGGDARQLGEALVAGVRPGCRRRSRRCPRAGRRSGTARGRRPSPRRRASGRRARAWSRGRRSCARWRPRALRARRPRAGAAGSACRRGGARRCSAA